jgi:predicted phage replisome organizer
MTSKKYYWLKLKEDFFEDDTINWIEDQEGGEKYSLFYLKLCLKSLKTNGILIRNVGEMLIPYDVKKLAEITRTDIDTVRVAMELFKNIGLIQILENGEIYLAQLKNMVGSETSKAQLMRNKRARDKELLEAGKKEGGNIVTYALPNCYTEIETEKEQEKEIEKELTDKQRERVEHLKDLLVGWSVSDNQIFYLSSLLYKKMDFDITDSELTRELALYEEFDKLIKKARAEDVKHIYRWLEVVIPNWRI